MTSIPGRVSFVVLTRFPEAGLEQRVGALSTMPLRDIEIVVVYDLPDAGFLHLEYADRVASTSGGLHAQRELGLSLASGAEVVVLEPGRALHAEVASALIDLFGEPVPCCHW